MGGPKADAEHTYHKALAASHGLALAPAERYGEGDLDGALEELKEAIDILREFSDAWDEAYNLSGNWDFDTAAILPSFDKARAFLENS